VSHPPNATSETAQDRSLACCVISIGCRDVARALAHASSVPASASPAHRDDSQTPHSRAGKAWPGALADRNTTESPDPRPQGSKPLRDRCLWGERIRHIRCLARAIECE
jgi:hypothetical protein